jgi:hypothetical protein
MQNLSKMLIVVCAFSTAAGVARGNLISNGSFETETPAVAAGTFQDFATGSTGISGWTVTGPSDTGLSAVSTSFGQSGVTFEAQSGNIWLDLTGDGTNSSEGISQSVTTVGGTSYALTFYVGNTTGGGVFGTTSTAGLKINGTQVGSFENSTADATGLNWQQFTYNFTASGTSTTIEFDNLDPSNDNSNGLDNVDLELGTSTVPEPSTFGLVGLALAAVAFCRRQTR